MNLLENMIFVLFFSALIGLLIGSFISMLTWRLPRLMTEDAKEQLKQISVTRSQCPRCKTSLPWYRLFPLFSWLALKGRCHACQHKISIRYPIIELTTMLTTLLVVWVYGPTPAGLFALIFIWFIITICVIDLEHFLILDNLSLPLLWIGLLINSQGFYTTPFEAIWGAAVGYLILWTVFHVFKLFTGKEGMGFGDFKLLAALGAWFGIESLPQIILIASLSNLIISIALAILKVRNLQEPIPFGPYLAMGGLTSLFFGSNLIQSI